MNVHELRKAERNIRNKINFSNKNFYHKDIGKDLELLPSDLVVAEYEFNDQTYFVIGWSFISKESLKNNHEDAFFIPLTGVGDPADRYLCISEDYNFLIEIIKAFDIYASIKVTFHKKTMSISVFESALHENYGHYTIFLYQIFSSNKSDADLNKYGKEILIMEMISDSFFEFDAETYNQPFVTRGIDDFLQWIFEGEEIKTETYTELYKLAGKTLSSKKNASFRKVMELADDQYIYENAVEDYIIENRKEFGEKAIKIIEKDETFNKLLSSLTLLESLALTDLQRSVRYITGFNLGSILLNIYCYTKNKNSLYFNSAIFNLWSGFIGLYDYKNLTAEEKQKDRLNSIQMGDSLSSAYNSTLNYIKQAQPKNDIEYLENLIAYGESKNLEFKASSKYSIEKKAFDKNLYFPIIKTICAFANSEGGKLIVGYYEKDQEFYDILSTDGFKDTDKWENYIRNHLDEKAGKYIGSLVQFEYLELYEKNIAVIKVKRDIERIMCKDINNPKEKKHFIRTGAYTKALNVDEAIHYWNSRSN